MSMECELCRRSVHEVGMLHRISPKGEPFKGRCNGCMGGQPTTTNESALLTALDGVETDR